jgi:hypothetical protein
VISKKVIVKKTEYISRREETRRAVTGFSFAKFMCNANFFLPLRDGNLPRKFFPSVNNWGGGGGGGNSRV